MLVSSGSCGSGSCSSGIESCGGRSSGNDGAGFLLSGWSSGDSSGKSCAGKRNFKPESSVAVPSEVV